MARSHTRGERKALHGGNPLKIIFDVVDTEVTLYPHKTAY